MYKWPDEKPLEKPIREKAKKFIIEESHVCNLEPVIISRRNEEYTEYEGPLFEIAALKKVIDENHNATHFSFENPDYCELVELREIKNPDYDEEEKSFQDSFNWCIDEYKKELKRRKQIERKLKSERRELYEKLKEEFEDENGSK